MDQVSVIGTASDFFVFYSNKDKAVMVVPKSTIRSITLVRGNSTTPDLGF